MTDKKPEYVQQSLDVPDAGRKPPVLPAPPMREWPVPGPARCERTHDRQGRLMPCSSGALVVIEANWERKALCGACAELARSLGHL